MPDETGPVEPSNLRLDSTSLRVLAHPLRSRLLSALRRDGPSTATRLAAQLGTNSGATSYHLRKLASVELVEENTDEGGRRERVWQAASEYHSWYPSDVAGDEDAESALSWLSRDYSRHMAEQYERWLDVAGTWPLPWQDACGSNDHVVLVTAEQLAAMNAEIEAVITRYRRVGQGNPEAKRVATYTFTYPVDLARRPRR